MDVFDEQMLSIWKAFKTHNLAYIMVGGFAVNLHGFQRTTGDVDIWIKDSKENRHAFTQCLQALNYADLPQIETIDFVPGFTTFLLNSGIELDIMTWLKGFDQEDFDNCLAYASIAKIRELEIPFLHINHLLEAKKATSRPKDLIDIIELEKIRKERTD
ncbi:hypothetical protein SAMN06298216_1933 [Spirosomataceae bacterium TFI 002]|nr:hypothetical protein SAMN06298216_1933 [Spirosomataceae bacterium TFI 002]